MLMLNLVSNTQIQWVEKPFSSIRIGLGCGCGSEWAVVQLLGPGVGCDKW